MRPNALRPLSRWFSMALALSAGSWLPAEDGEGKGAPDKGASEKRAPEKGTPQKGAADKDAADAALKPIAPKDLPPSTRPRPDPAKDQFLREAVFVRVDELVYPEKGDAYSPEVRVVENYLKEYLRRAGHPIARAPEAGEYRLEGSFEGRFHSTLKVLGTVTAWKFKGASKLRLLDRGGKEIENLDVPELSQENARSAEETVLHLRRHMAKILWDRLTLTGKTFTNAEVVSLINSLPSEPAATDGPSADEVVKRLAEIGLPAVPYLLESLADNRVVRLPSSYPGLKGRSLDDLRVYHLADKALEEVFQKVSRMSLDVGPDDPKGRQLLRVITLGWENEWRRFCKPFAESPNAQPRAPRGAPSQPSESKSPRKD